MYRGNKLIYIFTNKVPTCLNVQYQYKKPSAEKKLASNVGSFNSNYNNGNYIKKWCPNYHSHPPPPILPQGRCEW